MAIRVISMWVARIKLLHKDCISSQLTKKHGITNFVYCLNYYTEDGFNYFSIVHIPTGEPERVQAFIEDLKKDKRIFKLEQSENIIFTLVKEPAVRTHLTEFYNPKLFYVKPDVNSPDGYEYFEVGSWKKEYLQGLINMAKEKMNGELLSIEQKKLTDIYIPHIMPSLSDKQKHAVEIAYQHGYYDFPRRIELDKLAEIMGVSKSTYQEHLRLAEKKLMPLLIQQFSMRYQNRHIDSSIRESTNSPKKIRKKQ